MKKFENKDGSYILSKDVEIDTDDLIVENDEIDIKSLNEQIKKLIEKQEDDFVTKSTCLIHIYFTETQKTSGTLEYFKKSQKELIIPALSKKRGLYVIREIILWVGYDALITYLDKSTNGPIKKLSLEHIAGHEYTFLEDKLFVYNSFEIMEINGPLFKIKIDLASTT